MTITACSNCASTDLKIPGMGDGAIMGIGTGLSTRTCRACNLTAPALEFDEEADYLAFADGLAAIHGEPGPGED